MKLKVLSSALTQLSVEEYFEHLYIAWQQASGKQCRFALPLPANGWHQITLLAGVAKIPLTCQQAVKGELLVIDCAQVKPLPHFKTTIHHGLASLQTDADVFFANVAFLYRYQRLSSIPDISIRGPDQVFVSASQADSANLNHCVAQIVFCTEQQPGPSLVLQTDSPRLHIDGAQILDLRQDGSLRAYKLTPQ